MSSLESNLTIPPNRFSIDGMPTEVELRLFDGQDRVLPRIMFANLETGNDMPERSAIVHTFAFNGTTLLTPSAWDEQRPNLNIDTLDRTRLRGRLLVLDLVKGVQYGREEIKRLLDGERMLEGCRSEVIVLLRTQLMDRVLSITDATGVPDYEKLAGIQEDRPGLTPDGAVVLQEIEPKVVMIDNISFEPSRRDPGFHATQRLAAPNGKKFTPLVYHVGNTGNCDFKERHNGKPVRIELGNPPEGLLGYPVGVFVE
ncbi:MAG: cyclase family protein [Candidatus Peregrinibacteria bacterium]